MEFGGRPFGLGTIVDVDASFEIAGRFRPRPGIRKRRAELRLDRAWEEELRGAVGPRPTELRVRYVRHRDSTDIIQSTLGIGNAVEGREYSVSRRAGATQSERTDGSPITDDEQETVAADFAVPGTQYMILSALSGRRVAYGETVLVQGIEATPFIGARGSIEMTLVGLTQYDHKTVADFDVRMRGSLEGFTYDLWGAALVEVTTARLLVIHGTGLGEVDMDNVVGAGQAAVTEQFSYRDS